MVHALRAQVKNGGLCLDEPIDLPDGTMVDLVLADESDNLDEAERARLHEAIATSRAEFARGEGVPLGDVIRDLRTARR